MWIKKSIYLLSLWTLGACSGSLDSERPFVAGAMTPEPQIEQPEERPDEQVPVVPAPREVGGEQPVISLDVTCMERAAQSNPVGVGVDGALWWSTVRGGDFEVVTPGGDVSRVVLGGAPTALRPWTRDSAAFATGTRLFVREGDAVEEVRWPVELGEITDICGDPRVDGNFVVAGGLYQRAGNQWWRWSPPMGTFDASLAFADVASACGGRDGRTWLSSATSLYRANEAEVVRFEPADQLAIDPRVGVAARRGEALYFLEDDAWLETTFVAGGVTQLVGTAGHLWVSAGEELYHYAEGIFSRVEQEGTQVKDAMTLYPDPLGGLWLVTPTRACRAQTQETLQVRGLRPYQRTDQAELVVEVDVPVQVELDGMAVHDGAGPVRLMLERAGWHTVEVRAAAGGRRFDVWRVEQRTPTWEEDVQAIALASCGGSACHGSERDVPGQPRLVTYEEWVSRASAVESRVGVLGDMPPTSQRAGWTAENATTVVAWIRGGMKERSSDE